MASKLTECKVCGKEISKNAKKCPHCGEDILGTKLGKGCGIGCFVIIILFLLLMIIGYFVNTDTTQTKIESVKIEQKTSNLKKINATTNTLKPNATNQEISNAQTKVDMLLQELIGFKNDPQFHEYGFSVGEGCVQAIKWRKKVDKLENYFSNKRYPLILMTAPGYLRQLGLDYMRSKGQKTESTKIIEGYIKDGLL